jgi:Ca2+-binding EF-hand superfamily protein
LQDRITVQVAGALQPSIRQAEIIRSRRKRPQELGAYDYTMRAMSQVWLLEAEAAETGQNPFGGIDLSNFDIDGDGEIDWQEFVAAIMDDHELHNEENLAKVFRQLDVDSSGTLSLTEISTILGNEHQFSRQVLEAVKRNRGTGDGVETIQMTFDEFKNLMLSKGDLSSVSKKRRRDTIKNFSFSEVQTDENAEQNV